MRRVGLIALLILAAFGSESRGIEMFTYFGDGSRIGLPSLEVPIEAYPGIPLRSDRQRARRRAMRPGSPSRVPGTPLGGGITIRPMPTTAVPEPVAVEPVPTPKATPSPTAAENTASQPTAN
jgi:hypothetical protein